MANQIDNIVVNDDTTGLNRAINVASDDLFLSVDLTLQSGAIFQSDNIKRGTADPNVALVPGNEGDFYQRTLGATGQLWINTDGTTTGWSQVAYVGGPAGDVTGPVSSTDNAIVRFDGTTGKLIQNSGVIISDANAVTGAASYNGVVVETHASRHLPGGPDALTTAAPIATAVQIGNAAATGTAASFSRSDHTHAVAGGTPVNVTKAANADGTAVTFARSDHKHDVTTAAPAAVGVATASGEGTATTLARSDHTHASNTAPVNVTKAAAAIGTSGEPARADHKHDVTTATAVSVGTANAEGTATSLARSDHTHAVTGLSIAGQVQGDILYFNGTSWVRLPPGTAGQVLTTQGTGANPSWTGPKRYPNSATNPVTPAPGAGDTYYNTTLLMTMEYDATRSKWLSMDSVGFQFGRNGDLTPAGTYLRAINGMVMSATLGYDALYNGTVIGISIRRSTNSASNYAVTASGTDIATLAFVAGQGVRTASSNGDFVAGDVLAARLVSDAVVPESDVQMFVRIKWRV